jgi:hypothetical protein
MGTIIRPTECMLKKNYKDRKGNIKLIIKLVRRILYLMKYCKREGHLLVKDN